MFKKINLFHYQSDVPINYYQILGAGLCMLISILIGRFAGMPHSGTLSSFGIYTFFYYRRMPLKNLLVMLSWVGISMTLSFGFSLLGALIPWLIPFILAVVAFFSRFLLRLYSLAKPGPIFFMLVATTGTAFSQVTEETLLLYTGYFFFGVIIALIMAIFVHKMERGHISALHDNRTLKERLDDEPGSLLEALLYSGMIFLTAYFAYGLQLSNPSWMIFSATAILQGNTVEAMLNRNLQRIFGTIVGLGIAFILFTIPMPFWLRAVVIVILIMGFEFFTPRNYAVALCFVTPMVLLTASLANPNYSLQFFVPARLIGIVYGSIFGLVAGWLMVTCLQFYNQQFTLDIEDFTEAEARLERENFSK
ncbi:FUSC family protein [Aerococcaceae bacterium DSM 111176]|nr:FUSC family protein [Aerococcaceae bacterium DSM 111176]